MTTTNTEGWVECDTCCGSGKIAEEARTHGANQHSACQMDCEDCEGSGRLAQPEPILPGEGEGEEIGAEYDAAAHCVTLAECPPGLFFWNGSLGFKSEYGAMEPVGSNFKAFKVGNRADAYCVESGEFFWGGTSNHDDRARVLVYPIDAKVVAMVASHGPEALMDRPQPQSPIDGEVVEVLHIERMDDGLCWGRIDLKDGRGIVLWWTAEKKNRLSITVRDDT